MINTLNKSKLHFDEDINSLALYGYGSFTSFLYEKNGVKGFEKHLKRLKADSLFLFGIEIKREAVVENLKCFLKLNNVNNPVTIRVTIFPKDFSLPFPSNISDLNIMVTGKTYSYNGDKEISLSTFHELRIFPSHKTVNLIPNIKARLEAQKKGFNDALLVNNDHILETATANIFFYKDNILFTPNENILLGTTRNLIIESIIDTFEVKEKPITLQDIKNFDGCFITNAVIGVQSVNRIDDLEFGINKELIQNLKIIYKNIEAKRV